MTFGLIGKVFNCIIFLRKPVRRPFSSALPCSIEGCFSFGGHRTGLLLFLKTIFDTFPLLWTFIFDTKFFVHDDQFNASRILCALSRTSELFVSWSIGFVILACTVRLATIVHSRCLPQPTRLRVFTLILLMMICGLMYNWHIFYYPSLVQIILLDDQNRTFTYCNVLFGRQMGYFSFGGFQSTQEFLYNAPIVNFIVSSLIPFTIVASTNVVIILRVLKNPSDKRLSHWNLDQNGHSASSKSSLHASLKPMITTTEITRKEVSYETTITLTTSCVFLTTNSIASIYVYVKSSHRSNRSALTEDLKTSNVYLILRMLTLIDTVLEFYIYFLTGKKFRQEVYQVISEILQHTPLRHYFKWTQCDTLSGNVHRQEADAGLLFNKDFSAGEPAGKPRVISPESSYWRASPNRYRTNNSRWCDGEETLDRIESTV